MNREQFKAICRKSQNELMGYLLGKLRKKYNRVRLSKDYIFAEGEIPICLVAHLDTVHKELPRDIIEVDDKIYSPQGIGGDDRCGVYAILQIIKKHKCSVLFCCDEEIGGVGAEEFAKSKYGEGMKYYIELDRKGKKDAVFYECGNDEFMDYICGFGAWREEYGSYTDICDIAPAKGCSAVNFSVGYYNQHTLSEYVVPSEVDYCIDNVCKLIEASKDVEAFEWVQAPYYRGYYGYGCKDFYMEDDNGWGEESVYLVQFKGNKTIEWEEYEAHSAAEAIGKFAIDFPHLRFCDVLDVIDEGQYYSSNR